MMSLGGFNVGRASNSLSSLDGKSTDNVKGNEKSVKGQHMRIL